MAYFGGQVINFGIWIWDFGLKNPLFAVVGVSPMTLVACEDTSDGKKGNLCQWTKSLPAV
jgi:hypothetical protein